MRRSTATTVLSSTTLALALAAGCAPVDDGATDDNTETSTEALRVRACPESVTLGSDGQPRNAAGQIRQCWPSEARCFCDQDNDCYALSRYRACTPVQASTSTGARDAGTTTTTDAGARDAGSTTTTDAGARDAGSTTPTPTPSGAVPTVGGCQVFPANSPWNQDISGLPVASNSAAIIANIQAHGETTLKADFGSNSAYGIPFVVVPQNQSMVPIRFTEYGDESDPGPYPVPASAPIEGGNDHHVLVVQQGACVLYEMYHSSRSGSGWNAGSGAIFDLSSNALRPTGWTSCDQAGLPILAGLTRYDEVEAGEIRHALRVTFNHTRDAFIAPATHPGGEADVNAPPMGLRLRLKSSFDVSRYTGQARVMLNAMRRYGLIVADTGSNWYVSGGTDSRWNDDDLHQLTNVPGTAFEVVNSGPVQTR